MTFTLTVNEQELAILSEALGELPFKKAASLVSALQKQVNEQNQPKVEPSSGE